MNSATRNQLALLRSLQTRKGRDESGLFLAEGLRLVSELLDSAMRTEFVLVSTDRATDPSISAVLARFAERGATLLEAPAHAVERVSDTVHGQGILAAAQQPRCAPAELTFDKSALVLALDRVSDPGNLGTVIRTAAWFGASAVLLGEGCADPFNPKAVRATMGGLFHVPVARDVLLPEELDGMKRLGFEVTAATMGGSPEWRDWAREYRVVLVLGSEAHGVAPEVLTRADRRITIPRRGAGESLNVAVTAGIFRRRPFIYGYQTRRELTIACAAFIIGRSRRPMRGWRNWQTRWT